jgi:hypothetical protein
MEVAMKRPSFVFVHLVVLNIFLASTSGQLFAVQPDSGKGPIPLERLSMQERQKTSPDSTLVRLRNKTYTLGELRAAHRARTMAWSGARANGSLAAASLAKQKPKVVNLKANVVNQKNAPAAVESQKAAATTKTGSASSQQPVAPNTIKLNDAELQAAGQISVYEPPSDYAYAPKDMKAFCNAAGASACLYLPPQQLIQMGNNIALDVDTLIDAAQCVSDGGEWNTYFGASMCDFQYPVTIKVNFTPAANYQISSTVQCDQSIYTYQIDVHGAVLISINQSGDFTTGTSPWCVIKLNLG